MDDYINYIYAAPDGKTIDLYVAFYQAVGISGGYHSPKNCLPGSGWGIEQVQSFTLPTGIEGRNTSTVSEMVVRKQKTSQIVLYWYQNRGRIIGSEYMEKVFLVVDGLLKGRRDGAFVRLISHVDDKDIPATEAVLKKFSVLAMKELENFLPGKKKNQ
jgi:EpsI family protein